MYLPTYLLPDIGMLLFEVANDFDYVDYCYFLPLNLRVSMNMSHKSINMTNNEVNCQTSVGNDPYRYRLL